ncbi:MAG: hypothetical protein KJ737_08315 [Proteobacteria bacterium]|nr:hypothetical protein [Pseudomonadota bacterium]
MNNAKEVFKQMIDFNKGSMLNMCQSISLIQQQTENFTNTMLEQTTWLPGSGRDMISEWSKASKKGIESFKKSIEISYDKIEDMIS